jgi:hypothetical protein
MKIDVIPAQPDAPARGAPQALQFQLRNLWLREFEQAQLGWWAGDQRAPATARSRDSASSQANASSQEDEGSSKSVAPDQGASGCAVLAGLHAQGDAPRAAEDQKALQSEQAEGGLAAAPIGDAPARPLAQAPGDRDGAATTLSENGFVDPIPAPAGPSVPIAAGAAGPVTENIVDQTQTPEAPRSAGATLPPSAQQWPARSVHMMSDVGGAKVWIRDAGLAHESAGRIVSSLADELAQRGMRLRALTVNGRVVFEAERPIEPEIEPESGSDTGAVADPQNPADATADTPSGRLRQGNAGFETVLAKRR